MSSMKKLLLAFALILLPSVISAEERVQIDGFYYKLSTKTNVATITRTDSKIPTESGLIDVNRLTYAGDVVIPDKVVYEGVEYTVTGIDKEAFSRCEDMTSVVIPNTVTSIGDRSFYVCTSLVSANIPNSVISIGESAFEWCKKLAEIDIPNSVLSIGKFAFRSCESLKSVNIPSSLITIPNYCFAGCGISSLTIPNTITAIGDRAFAACKSLTSVTIPSSVTALGEGAFIECISLPSIAIPSSVTAIGSNAFSYCSGLKSVHITDLKAWCNIKFDYDLADELKYSAYSNPLCHGTHLFLNGEEITELSIPEGVTTIERGTFCGWGGQTVHIPNSVTTIGTAAFLRCGNLKSVVISNSVKTIGSRAFSACDNLETVTIGNGVEAIYNWAFSYCSMLKDVYCYAKKVPETIKDKASTIDIFFYSEIEGATLYVPASALDDYKRAWTGFKDYVPLDEELGIGNPTQQNDEVNKYIFDLSGRKVSQSGRLPKGVYIQGGKKFVIK